MNFLEFTQSIHQQLEEFYNQDIESNLVQVQKTRKDFTGDITLVVFPLLRISKKKPEETGEEIGKHLLKTKEIFQSFDIVKGFLNLTLSDPFLLQAFSQFNVHDISPKTNDSVIVEYASPNTNKPLHLGHIRNILLGYSVSNILKYAGHEVIKTQIINDRGIHICKSMLAWQKFGGGETPESSGMKGDKLVGKYYVRFDQEYKKQVQDLIAQGANEEEAKQSAPILLEAREMLQKWEQRDPEVIQLWTKLNGWVYDGFDQTYDTLGVDFDKLYYESNTYLEGKKMVEEGLSKGVFYQKEDGSVWCDLTKDGLDQKLLLRSDGTSLYMTQDLGTAVLRFKDFPKVKKQIYTVGNEQDYHFKVLFIILQKLGYAWAKDNFHLSYGMMELPSGKMKSREGTVVDADDLMLEMYETAKQKTLETGKLEDLDHQQKEELYWSIGLGALKYFILKVDPKKKMLFNPEESVELNGNTGPFIQYTHARTRSILNRAEKVGYTGNLQKGYKLSESEKTVVKTILDFPNVLGEAAANYSPAVIANYVYDLAKNYNHFYQSHSILKAETEEEINFRVFLSQKAGQTLKEGLTLLGIHAPEQM